MQKKYVILFLGSALAALLTVSCLKPIDCYLLTVTASNAAGGSTSGSGYYAAGAEATISAKANTGYCFDRWDDGSRANPRKVSVNGDITYTAFFSSGGGTADTSGGSNPADNTAFDGDGATYSTFSVSDTKAIHFSRGNLQYNAATNRWRFAEHQYDRIGQGNSNISPSYNGWIDLFGWATSGWNSGASAYQPWSTSTQNSDYFTGGDLSGAYAEADWAWHNPIVNGGNQRHMWRLPTAIEWNYLLYGRENAMAKRTYATVNGQHGLIILPDDWETPSGIDLSIAIGNWGTNTYSVDQWDLMERAGAIFLPTTGARRHGTQVVEEDVTGFYISSTLANSDYYHHLSFSTIFGGLPIYAPGNGTISEGQGVRPIRD